MRLTNNIIVNNIAIFFGVDKYMKNAYGYWRKYLAPSDKTHQQIAGYSHIKEVEETLEKVHETLKNITTTHIRKRDKILDIGCGPGLFLMDFKNDYELHGIDLSSEILKLAKQNNPSAIFYEGDFMTKQFDIKFNLIYSVGMLLYVKRSDLEKFFDKLDNMLETGGIIFISYPHALSRKDLYYPDINYINYSPELLNKIASQKFNVLQNKHAFDDRLVTDYDRTPFKPKEPGMDRIYRNSSILIIKKKN